MKIAAPTAIGLGKLDSWSPRLLCPKASPPLASLCDAPRLGHAVDLQGVLDVIEGNPCTLSCNEVTGECTFDIQDFFVTLIAPCTNAQCIVEGYTASQGV